MIVYYKWSFQDVPLSPLPSYQTLVYCKTSQILTSCKVYPHFSCFPTSPAIRPHANPGLRELMIPWPVPAQMVILFFKSQERQSCFHLSLFLCLLIHILQPLEWRFYSLTGSWEPFTGYLSLFQQPETPSPNTLKPGSTRFLPWVSSVLFHNRGKGLCVPKAKFILLMILHLTINPILLVFGPAWLW